MHVYDAYVYVCCEGSVSTEYTNCISYKDAAVGVLYAVYMLCTCMNDMYDTLYYMYNKNGLYWYRGST